MTGSSPSLIRRLAVAAALLVPLVVDPYGADTQGLKGLALALCGAVALAAFAIEVARGRPGGALTWPERLLLGLTAWYALSTAWAENPAVAWTRTFQLIGMYGVARGVRAMIGGLQTARQWLLAMVAVAVAAVLIDARAIMAVAGALEPANRKYASLLFVHNNMAATYVTMVAPVVVAFALGARPRRASLGWLAVLALMVAYLEQLDSRAGTLAAVLAVVVVGALFAFRRRIERTRVMDRRWALPLVGLVVVLALLPFSDAVRALGKQGFNRVVAVLGVDLGDVVRRPILWRKTAELAFDNPVGGVGAGNFVVVFPRYEHLRAAMPHAHNDALQVLSETGFVGLLLFLGLLVATGWSLARTLASGRGTRAFTLAAALAGSLVVFAVGGLFEVPFAMGATAANLAVLVGMAGALGEERPRRGRAWSDTVPVAVGTLAVSLAVAWAVVSRLPASMHMVRGAELQAQGDSEAAFAQYEQVARMGTGIHLPPLRMGLLRLRQGDEAQRDGRGEEAMVHYAEALEHVADARALWPYGWDLVEVEGDVLFRLVRYEQAIERYRRATDARPEEPGPRWKLVTALERAGRDEEAVALLEYEVRRNQEIGLDKVTFLAEMLTRRAERVTGDQRVEALVAARHFFALLLEDGDARRRSYFNERFKHLTHLLQLRPGSPDSWWAAYDAWRDQGGWRHLPQTALYTSVDADGIKLFPGWKETAGPPLPRSWRH